MSDGSRLFTTRFFVMCGFSFSVFLSAFQLLPTAPFHIHDLGGSTFAAGLFLGFLTYASAVAAPLTGSWGDRMGQRRIMLVSSLAIALITASYAFIPDYRAILALAVVQGVFWSGMLSNSASYMVTLLPEQRRAEGISYWGLSTIAAIAVAPPVGFWLYQHGWIWVCAVTSGLNLATAFIAYSLQDHPRAAEPPDRAQGLFEWRVLVLAVTMFLYSFSYGGITSFSAIYAEALGIRSKGIYLTSLALIMLVTRPFAGRLADRIGYRRVLYPCLVLIAMGLGLLATRPDPATFVASAVVFGAGFGTAYPVFVAYVMQHVAPNRRGAAFGGILACFDIGIGTGSTLFGYLIQRVGFQTAFGVGAAVAGLALPYFLLADRLLFPSAGLDLGTGPAPAGVDPAGR